MDPLPRTPLRQTVSACAAGLCLGVGSAWAQDAASQAVRSQTVRTEAPNLLDTTAQAPRVAHVSPLAANRVDRDTGKLSLRHGEIKHLDMRPCQAFRP